MNEGQVLEALYAARASIAPGTYEYQDYSRCTCGHIYNASGGGEGYPDEAREGSLYERALQAVVDANPQLAERTRKTVAPLASDCSCEECQREMDPAWMVSSMTAELATERMPLGDDEGRVPANEGRDIIRQAAVDLITAGIERLESRQMRSMLAVKAVVA